VFEKAGVEHMATMSLASASWYARYMSEYNFRPDEYFPGPEWID
jgi:hypothetical protein